MNSSAVVDIGSLKVKFFIFNNKRELLQSGSILTLLNKGLDGTNKVSESSLARLDSALSGISSIIKRHGNGKQQNLRVIGTEALRKASNAQAAHDIAARHFDIKVIDVIDQQTEAELFFLAVSKPFANKRIAALDVGGGSVQLTAGTYNQETGKNYINYRYHTATGSYRIQQKYSPHDDVISPYFSNARRTVNRAFGKCNLQVNTLVFGSTCMLNMLQATGVKLYYDKPLPYHPVYTTLKDLHILLRHIRTFAPQDRQHLYPQGGYFMYGADYLLLNVIEVARRINASTIYPSNFSGAYALAA